jgi:hypothetical protein
MIVLSAPVHESLRGTKLPIRDVRNPDATGGKTDMEQVPQFGRV